MPRTPTQLPPQHPHRPRLPRGERTPGSRALAALVSGALLVTPVTPEARASALAQTPAPPSGAQNNSNTPNPSAPGNSSPNNTNTPNPSAPGTAPQNNTNTPNPSAPGNSSPNNTNTPNPSAPGNNSQTNTNTPNPSAPGNNSQTNTNTPNPSAPGNNSQTNTNTPNPSAPGNNSTSGDPANNGARNNSQTGAARGNSSANTTAPNAVVVPTAVGPSTRPGARPNSATSTSQSTGQSAAPATEAPAGDENIPLEAPEEGQRAPLAKGRISNGAVQSASYSIGRRGNAEVAAEMAGQADAAFDAENYGEAARLYTKVLELLSENETNHVMRSVVLANAITSYEQVYVTTREVNHLRTAQRLLQEYLRACKTKHGTGCDRYPETQEARARLQSVMAEIDIAAPKNMRIPPEIDRAPGGKAYDLTVKLPSAPSWIAPTMVGGAIVAGGGAALIYYAVTADKYGPIYKRDLPGETGDTTTADTTTADTTTADTTTADTTTADTTDPSTGGSGGGSGLSGYELSPETKGKLLVGVGAFLAAAGVGFIILGAMGISKHRRANRRRAQSLAVTPTFGRSSAGLAISGSF